MELPVSDQERGEGKSEGRIRRATILPLSRGDAKKQHPIGGAGYYYSKEQTRASSGINAASINHQEPVADRARTEEDECWDHR
jgi:hypothetical protein